MFSLFKPKLSKEDKVFKADLKEILGITPSNIRLYKTAMIHRSVSLNLSSGTSDNNERLEYLGDAIIDAIVADYLFEQYPTKREGFLSQMRSKIVSRKTLNTIALSSNIAKHIIVRHGVNINDNKNIFGNVIEALIGALFLDKGYVCAKQVFIDRLLTKYIDLEQLEFEEIDHKSRLVEWGQKHKLSIMFSCTEEPGCLSHQKDFVAVITLNSEPIAEGKGSSKKQAEQKAAHNAWDYISSSSHNILEAS